MSKRPNKTSIALAVSAALAASLTGSSIAQADTLDGTENLLGASTLQSGYLQFAGKSRDGEGKCGEGKCGDAEDDEAKGNEGKCGEGKCGDAEADEAKGEEGKCGEGKCGNA